MANNQRNRHQYQRNGEKQYQSSMAKMLSEMKMGAIGSGIEMARACGGISNEAAYHMACESI